MKIAFQGEKGAYSEEACLNYFNEEVETIGYPTSEEVVEALTSKKVALAVLPMENSIVGNVSINLDLLYHEEIFAVGETYLPIHHHLMGLRGSSLDNITSVFSHPIALAQCRDFLLQNKIKPMSDYDTAGACKHLAEKENKAFAAIGSKLCAETYGLEIISDQIQRTKNNITRFFVLARKEEAPEIITVGKTSLAFLAHHHPGALLDCLEIFKKYQINLTKLESRPIITNPFEYVFFVDFNLGLNDSKTQSCLEELNRDAHHVKILGSYPEGKKPTF